eukprot:gnl/TRDRNA2_/TRDRNA2_43539_c0_seq1.p1 gnl/TRDRNA2_/TRDRNA2_43539_c0~~gnl/TRDRNA2_/TRDRNA2_43539_c0_seq1.p1  ORF type:complete len:620 (-),score=146.94 gnl/TRDRNA2_/TRDRNA2_43539_c0_seq1:79-1938(-)
MIMYKLLVIVLVGSADATRIDHMYETVSLDSDAQALQTAEGKVCKISEQSDGPTMSTGLSFQVNIPGGCKRVSCHYTMFQSYLSKVLFAEEAVSSEAEADQADSTCACKYQGADGPKTLLSFNVEGSTDQCSVTSCWARYTRILNALMHSLDSKIAYKNLDSAQHWDFHCVDGDTAHADFAPVTELASMLSTEKQEEFEHSINNLAKGDAKQPADVQDTGDADAAASGVEQVCEMSETEPGYGMSIYAKTTGKCNSVSCHYSMFNKYISQTIVATLKLSSCRCDFHNSEQKQTELLRFQAQKDTCSAEACWARYAKSLSMTHALETPVDLAAATHWNFQCAPEQPHGNIQTLYGFIAELDEEKRQVAELALDHEIIVKPPPENEEISKLMEVFTEIDTDHSGALDAEEIQAALTKLGLHADDAKIQKLLTEEDTNKDGELQLKEFIDLAMDLPSEEVSEEEEDDKSESQESGLYAMEASDPLAPTTTANIDPRDKVKWYDACMSEYKARIKANDPAMAQYIESKWKGSVSGMFTSKAKWLDGRLKKKCQKYRFAAKDSDKDTCLHELIEKFEKKDAELMEKMAEDWKHTLLGALGHEMSENWCYQTLRIRWKEWCHVEK